LCSNVEHADLDLVLYEKLLDDFVTIFLKIKADLVDDYNLNQFNCELYKFRTIHLTLQFYE